MLSLLPVSWRGVTIPETHPMLLLLLLFGTRISLHPCVDWRGRSRARWLLLLRLLLLGSKSSCIR